MLPPLTKNYDAYRLKADWKQPRFVDVKAFPAFLEKFSNAKNVPFPKLVLAASFSACCCWKFCQRMFFATGLATLSHFVSHVILMRSKPKMPRITAAWSISTRTVMEHLKSFGNKSVSRYPCGLVSENDFPIKPKSAIPVLMSYCPAMWPAGIPSSRFVNSTPEPFLVGMSHNEEHSTQRQSCRHSESRNRQVEWKEFLVSLFSALTFGSTKPSLVLTTH